MARDDFAANLADFQEREQEREREAEVRGGEKVDAARTD